MARPRLVVLAPGALFRSFFDEARQRRLDRSYRWTGAGNRTLGRELRASLAEADGLVTTWDSPRFGEELLRLAPRLRIIGHCGGEVKARFARPLFERLTITNAPGPMSGYVAELAVTFLLHAARNLDAHRDALRRRSAAVYRRIHRDGVGEETILGRTVGLLGFGQIGRSIAALLRPFGVRLGPKRVARVEFHEQLLDPDGGLAACRVEDEDDGGRRQRSSRAGGRSQAADLAWQIAE